MTENEVRLLARVCGYKLTKVRGKDDSYVVTAEVVAGPLDSVAQVLASYVTDRKSRR